MKVNIPTRLRDWPLRTQLMLVFGFLSITPTAVSIITVTTLSGQRTQTSLRDRSLRIAQRLQQQLEPILVFNDQLAARQLFAAYAGDRELDGVGVYDSNGELIEGLGIRPPRFGSNADLGTNKGHLVVAEEIKTPYGRSGRLYLSFSTRLNDQLQRHDIWIATGFGASVILCALILAVRMARRIARRLVQIADAANRVASGEWSHTVLGDQAKDEIGTLAHSFNVMVVELKRLSIDHERLASTERERLSRTHKGAGTEPRNVQTHGGKHQGRAVHIGSDARLFSVHWRARCRRLRRTRIRMEEARGIGYRGSA